MTTNNKQKTGKTNIQNKTKTKKYTANCERIIDDEDSAKERKK